MADPDEPTEERSPSDVEAVERVRSAGRALRPQNVPKAVESELDRIFEAEQQRTDNEYDYVEALLMRDSRTAMPVVGSRSAQVHQDWSVSFRASNLDIMLEPGRATATVGQILPIDGSLGSYRVSVTGPSAVTVRTDERGWFELGHLLDGNYELRAERTNFGVWLRFTI